MIQEAYLPKRTCYNEIKYLIPFLSVIYGKGDTVGTKDLELEGILRTLQECRGVLALKVLSEEEKREILDTEGRVEEKIVFGMCKSLNKGLREALQREFTVAMVIQTSEFQYPHHPYMSMICGDQVVGELIRDEKRVEELRKIPGNLFLWENFVVYMKKLPRNPKERDEMRVVYLPREPLQLKELPCTENSVFGTPSTEGDTLIKRILTIQCKEPTVGTCLVGFNIKK